MTVCRTTRVSVGQTAKSRSSFLCTHLAKSQDSLSSCFRWLWFKGTLALNLYQSGGLISDSRAVQYGWTSPLVQSLYFKSSRLARPKHILLFIVISAALRPKTTCRRGCILRDTAFLLLAFVYIYVRYYLSESHRRWPRFIWHRLASLPWVIKISWFAAKEQQTGWKNEMLHTLRS